MKFLLWFDIVFTICNALHAMHAIVIILKLQVVSFWYMFWLVNLGANTILNNCFRIQGF